MLHDTVVPMGVNANVGIFRETEINDAAEYTVSIRKTGNTVDYMIWLFIIKLLALSYSQVHSKYPPMVWNAT